MATTKKQRRQLKEAGFEWGLCYDDEGDGCRGCLRHGWLGQTMNTNKPGRCDYLVPTTRCLACLGISIEEAIEIYCD